MEGEAGFGFAGGASLFALGASQLAVAKRLRAGLLPVLLILTLCLTKAVWAPDLLLNRYDFAPDSTIAPEERLARLTGVPRTSGGEQTVVLLFRRRAVVMKVPRQTVVGLSGDKEAARRVESFLERRGFATALADPAFKAMHDAASLSWNPVESLRIDYLNLTRCPDTLYLPLFLARLESATAADERQFAFPDRGSLVRMGDVYARLGERDRAEQWYHRAQLPESQVGARLAERTMFADGRISGRLLIQGQPAAGEHVALVPAGAVDDLWSAQIRPGVARPFWLRWITATTVADAAGRFAFDHLIAGEYRLALLTDRDLGPPLANLPIRQAQGGTLPWELFVGFGKPATDVGTIEVATDH